MEDILIYRYEQYLREMFWTEFEEILINEPIVN